MQTALLNAARIAAREAVQFLREEQELIA